MSEEITVRKLASSDAGDSNPSVASYGVTRLPADIIVTTLFSNSFEKFCPCKCIRVVTADTGQTQLTSIFGTMQTAVACVKLITAAFATL